MLYILQKNRSTSLNFSSKRVSSVKFASNVIGAGLVSQFLEQSKI